MKQNEWANKMAEKLSEWNRTKSIPLAWEICKKLFDKISGKDEK